MAQTTVTPVNAGDKITAADHNATIANVADHETRIVAEITRAQAAEVAASYPVQPVGTDALQRRTLAEFHNWHGWLRQQGVNGYLGEFGVPTTGTDVASWAALLEVYYKAIDEAGVGASQWSSGRGWGTTFPLGVYVNGASNGDVNTATTIAAVTAAHPQSRLRGHRGVNLSGFEFPVAGGGANSVRTGTNFVHTQADLTYLASQGVKTVRLGMAWERMQPTLKTALDSTALTNLGLILTRANTAGIKVILDLHNYARYTATDNTTVSVIADTGGTVDNTHLVDFWQRLSSWVVSDSTRTAVVLGYGLMNEPHDLASGAFVTGRVLHPFTSTVEGFTGPTPTFGAAPSGANSAIFPITTGGGEPNDNGYWSSTGGGSNPLSQYGTSLQYVFEQPAGMTGYFTVDPHVQAGPSNPTASQYTDIQASLFVNVGSTSPTAVTWTPATGTLDSVNWIGFYAGGSGRTGTQNLYLDSIKVGTGRTPAKVWEYITQQVVGAIRAQGDNRLITVSGYNYAHVDNWAATHPQSWISDPAHNFAYEGHHYWDTTSSVGSRTGTYVNGSNPLAYSTELAAATSGGF